MTTYIIWPKTIDSAFRADYLAITGEAIQQDPQENEARDQFLAGSSRLTDGQILSLATSYPEAVFSETIPSDWVPFQEDPV